MLSSAVAAATGASAYASAGSSPGQDLANSRTLIPPHLRDSGEKISFIAAQRDRLNIVLSALDREAAELQRTEAQRAHDRIINRGPSSMSFDGTEDEEPTQRPPSGLSAWSGLSKSRSEGDFEKIDAESGAEDDSSLRRRKAAGAAPAASWTPSWGWTAQNDGSGQSSGAER